MRNLRVRHLSVKSSGILRRTPVHVVRHQSQSIIHSSLNGGLILATKIFLGFQNEKSWLNQTTIFKKETFKNEGINIVQTYWSNKRTWIQDLQLNSRSLGMLSFCQLVAHVFHLHVCMLAVEQDSRVPSSKKPTDT